MGYMPTPDSSSSQQLGKINSNVQAMYEHVDEGCLLMHSQ
jgi:hypothetical protein